MGVLSTARVDSRDVTYEVLCFLLLLCLVGVRVKVSRFGSLRDPWDVISIYIIVFEIIVFLVRVYR